VKLFATVSVILVALILFSATVSAQIRYSVDTDVKEDGSTLNKLTITFPHPETHFSFTVKGEVKSFNATSNAGPVVCSVDTGVVSFVSCTLNLTQEKRTLYIDFETKDFVKIGDKYYFDGDFTLNKDINYMSVSVRLPEGMAPVKDKGLFPPDAVANWDLAGRRLTVVWNLNDIKSDQVLRFQILYERLQQPPLRLSYFIIGGVVAAIIIILFILYRMRKSEQLILSVLDDFEKKVMDVIIAADGIVNQKKVVQETNLSKAKVSRVVKSLVERGVIEVERRGRANILKLVKKKFKI
jgi:uncharacterized membrane protein